MTTHRNKARCCSVLRLIQRSRAFSSSSFYGSDSSGGARVEKSLPFDAFDTRRLLGALIGIAGRDRHSAQAPHGQPIAGVAALTLLATTPLYYGHMFTTRRMRPAVAMVFCCSHVVRAFDEYAPRPSTIPIRLAFGLS
jgi:hypothetical protein